MKKVGCETTTRIAPGDNGSMRSHEPVPVFSFNRANDLPKWDLSSKDSASWVQGGWPDGRKGVCAKLTVHTRKIPSECTGLILNGKDMLCTDWRNLEALCVDVFAGQPGLLQVEAGSFGKALARVNIRLVQGRNHCRIPGRALRSMDLAKMDKLRIEVANGEQEALYCFSDIVLRRPRLATVLRRIERKSEFFRAARFAALPPQERKAADEQCAELWRVISSLKTSMDTAGASSRSLDLFENADALMAELDILVQRNRICSPGRNGPLIALWCSSLEKVHRARQRFSRLPRPRLTLTAARGESQGAQLVLLSKTGLMGSRAAVSR